MKDLVDLAYFHRLIAMRLHAPPRRDNKRLEQSEGRMLSCVLHGYRYYLILATLYSKLKSVVLTVALDLGTHVQ